MDFVFDLIFFACHYCSTLARQSANSQSESVMVMYVEADAFPTLLDPMHLYSPEYEGSAFLSTR